MPVNVSPHEIRLLRMRSQRLSNNLPYLSPEDSLSEVFCLQAQELPSAILSLRPRSKDLTEVQVETARKVDATIQWTWSLRGTLHLLTARDSRWLIPLLAGKMIGGGLTRMKQLGWEEHQVEKAITQLCAELGKREEMTRPEIREWLKKNGFPYEGQAPTHLLFRMVFRGLICTGSGQGKQPTFVLYNSRNLPMLDIPRQKALADLAHRYLHAYAPARAEDLAAWSGINIGEARQAFSSIRDSLTEVVCEDQSFWYLEESDRPIQSLNHSGPSVKLLPRYDTYIMGYANRKLTMEPSMKNFLMPGSNGVINACLIVDGWVSGIWKLVRTKRMTEIQIQPFTRKVYGYNDQLENEVQDIGRFLGEDTKLILAPPIIQ